MKECLLKRLAFRFAICWMLATCSVRGATVSWIGGSGDWNNTNNWSTGALPGTNDDVVLNLGPSITVTHSSGTHVVHSIQGQQLFVLSGGSLTVSNSFQTDNTFTMSGGTLRGAQLQITGGASLVVSGSATLDGVTLLSGTLDVGSTVNNVALTVTNGLGLNGTVLVGNSTNHNYGQIDIAGSQAISGNGSVVFGNNTTITANALRLVNTGTTLTIGTGITITGQNGAVGYSAYWGGTTNVSVINQGTVVESVNQATITIGGAWILNQNMLQSQGGGNLILSATLTNTSTIDATNASLTLAAGTTTPNLGTVNASNATVFLASTLVNTNATLSVNILGGRLQLQSGGYVFGGAVVSNLRMRAYIRSSSAARWAA
jgi:hypothetical protein